MLATTLRTTVFVIGILFTSAEALAWSATGHKIIAQIAFDHIQLETKNQIVSLMGNETIQDSSWWPDQIKDSTKWSHTKGYHYKELNPGMEYFSSLKNASDYQKRKGDIIRALIKAEDMLRNPLEPKSNKQNAFRFLVHFMGDIHQPLHAGYISDVGGNTINLLWFGSNKTLHSVWDGGLISSFAYKNNMVSSYVEAYTQELRKPSSQEILQWNKKYIMDWFLESLAFREDVYVGIKDSSEEYYSQHIDLNNDRLLQAGYRLANWLDILFANQPLNLDAKKLRLDIQNLIGTESQFEINLNEKTSVRKKSVH